MNDPTLLRSCEQDLRTGERVWGESTPIPNATFTLLPESGHLRLLEPERALDQIVAWLRARA
jgi:hypothetical protein